MSKPTIHRLKNGISVIVSRTNHAPSMSLMVFVKVGSRYETRDENGVSHFIEHLMFKGTTRRPSPLDISRELDRYGAEFNAFTGKDLTAYYIKIDAAHAALAVDLLHDMIRHSTFAPKELDRERSVIVEEINLYEDNPHMHIDDLLEGALFPGNTLGWTITGPRTTIKTIPRDIILNYRDRYYIPSRLTIAVAGTIPANTLKALDQTFGQMQEPLHPSDASFAPFQPPRKLLQPQAVKIKRTEQAQLGIAYYGLPYGDSALPAMSLLSTILGGSMSSRLFTEVREKRGLCYSIHASHHAFEDTGFFSIMAGLECERLPEALRVIRQEIRKLVRTPVTQNELTSAKDHIGGKLKLAFEDSSTSADWYGKQYVFRRTLETPEERLAKISRVTAADIHTLARRIFRSQYMASSLIGPFSKGHPLNHLYE